MPPERNNDFQTTQDVFPVSHTHLQSTLYTPIAHSPTQPPPRQPFNRHIPLTQQTHSTHTPLSHSATNRHIPQTQTQTQTHSIVVTTTHISTAAANAQSHALILPSVSPPQDPSPAPRLSLPEPQIPLAPPSPPLPPYPPYPHTNQSTPPPPPRPGIISRPPPKEGGHPHGGGGVPRQRASELGMLLGCSVVLGVVVTLGLRCLLRRCCRCKRSEVCLSERSRRWDGDDDVIHVREYDGSRVRGRGGGGGRGGDGGGGELVQVRRIRQDSLLLLQTEFNLITPPGN